MDQKKCSKCNVYKTFDKYYNDKQKSDGKDTKCKDCSNLKNKKYYEENKDKMKQYNKVYREQNKDKLIMKDKKYYEENKEKIALRDKYYRENNKEKIAQHKKKYREENKEKITEQRKLKYQENKEEIKQERKLYYQNNKVEKLLKAEVYRINNRKRNRIYNWKKAGMICNDFDKLYDLYDKAENCYLCGVLFENISGNFKKCLDHDHLSGYPRFICCQRCNTKLLAIDNKRKDVLLELYRYFNTI